MQNGKVYLPVGWIKNPNSAYSGYFNTNVKIKANSTVRLVCENRTANWATIIGGGMDRADYRPSFLLTMAYDKTTTPQFIYGSTRRPLPHTFPLNKKMTFVMDKGKLFADDEHLATLSWGTTAESKVTCRIFGDGTYSMHHNGTIYECQIFEGETCVRDFYPARDKDSNCGLWDKVTSKFFLPDNPTWQWSSDGYIG